MEGSVGGLGLRICVSLTVTGEMGFASTPGIHLPPPFLEPPTLPPLPLPLLLLPLALSILPPPPLPLLPQPYGLFQDQQLPFQHLGPVLNIPNLLEFSPALVGDFLVALALLFEACRLLRERGFLPRDGRGVGVDVRGPQAQVGVQGCAQSREGGGEGGAGFGCALWVGRGWRGGHCVLEGGRFCGLGGGWGNDGGVRSMLFTDSVRFAMCERCKERALVGNLIYLRDIGKYV